MCFSNTCQVPEQNKGLLIILRLYTLRIFCFTKLCSVYPLSVTLETFYSTTRNVHIWIYIVSMFVIDRIVVHSSSRAHAIFKSTIVFAIRIRIHFSLPTTVANMSMALANCSSECANRSSRNLICN
jgi:hypothetical protein